MKMFKMLAVAGAMVAGTAAMAQEKFITIGTGGQTGVYFVVGQSICRLVNRGSADHGMKCTAPSTGGPIANINAIKAGDMDMGVAQSDWQFHAYNGSAKFEGAKFDKLRAVFSVHGDDRPDLGFLHRQRGDDGHVHNPADEEGGVQF